MSKRRLNITVDPDLVERARRYSERHNTSISRLVRGRARNRVVGDMTLRLLITGPPIAWLPSARNLQPLYRSATLCCVSTSGAPLQMTIQRLPSFSAWRGP